MAEFLELLAVYAGTLIYGSAAKPRHPVFPAFARVLAIGGLLLAFWALLLYPDIRIFPIYLSALWAFVSVTVALAEFELGSRGVSCLLMIGFAALLGLGLWVEAR